MEKQQQSCYDCIHKKSNHEMNSAHIRCMLFWKAGFRHKNEHPKGDDHGVKNGWYNFPYDYDPTWMTEECSHFESKKKSHHISEL